MMELALQLVGMKMTGKVADAKHVAETIVKNNKQTIGSTLLSGIVLYY